MRPIILDEHTRQQILNDMAEKLASTRNYTDFKYTYTPANLPTEQKIKVIYSPKAWIKQSMLVSETSIECAWHGIVTTNEERTIFTIEDILPYPQITAATTVNIDDARYEDWHQALDDNDYNALRLQGHSHVNMGVVPSGTDTTLYSTMLDALGTDSFYLFCIYNKKHQCWWNVYDLRHNVIYEAADLTVSVDGFSEMPLDWYNTMSKIYFARPTYTTPTYTAKQEPWNDPFYVSDRYFAQLDDIPVSKRRGGKKHGSK